MSLNDNGQEYDFEMSVSNQENDHGSVEIEISIENIGAEQETPILAPKVETVTSEREYFFGHDKNHGGRMWIQTHHDPTKYNLYTLKEQKDNEDIYKCIQCTRYQHRGHMPSTITVRHLEDNRMELHEKRNHYPSCSHDKSFIDKIQLKYHRTPRSLPNGVSKPKLASTPRPNPTLQNQEVSVTLSTEQPSKRRSVRISQAELEAERAARFRQAELEAERAARQAELEAETHSPAVNFSSPFSSRPFLIKPSSDAPSSIRKRSRTQVVQPAPLQNHRVVRDDSVASNFSHLFSSFQARTTTLQLSSHPLGAFSRVNPTVASLKHNEMGSSSNTARLSTPTQLHVPTPPPIQQHVNKPTEFPGLRFLRPKILSIHESFNHCIPSTHNLREMSALLGLDFQSQNQMFWHSTYVINEITGRAKPYITQNVTMHRNIGFQAISMFLTSSEESAFKIQESVKQYIFQNLQNYVDKKSDAYNDLLQSALCSYQLEDVHLWVLTKIINVRIVVFGVEGIQSFGDIFDDTLPSILLKKENDGFLPVLSVQR